MSDIKYLYLITFLCLWGVSNCLSMNCTIPKILWGVWFSRESGRNTLTELDATIMTDKGECVDIKNERLGDYTMVFRKDNNCFSCVKLLVRNINVLEKIETPCLNVSEEFLSVEKVCRYLDSEQQLITLFSENYTPVNCRSSLEGVWNFSYQNRLKFTGECRNPDAQIRACQTAGSQYLKSNKKFNISYQECEGITDTYQAVAEYTCLGDWFVGKNHYFAVVNTRESRKNEKYRCVLKNRDNESYIGISVTAECNTLNTVVTSPERLHITPVKPETVKAGCRLPQNFSGDWINTANIIDADIFINETHIIETSSPDEGIYKKTIYVCREKRDTRVMMARFTDDGCENDFICFDFVPQSHNIIRYRRGLAMIKDDFNTACSEDQFQNKTKLKFDLYLKKNPLPIRCPFAGRFNFTQKGDVPFETRIPDDGIPLGLRPNIYCKQNISDFSVCGTDEREITINENYCLAVDYLGRAVDVYSDPDYRIKCIFSWKENRKSYLITYNEQDPFSKYRCWVYQRVDFNKVLMSQAIGPFCHLNQDAISWNYTQGASVALEMQEYEREFDHCPLHFDDGTNILVDI